MHLSPKGTKQPNVNTFLDRSSGNLSLILAIVISSFLGALLLVKISPEVAVAAVAGLTVCIVCFVKPEAALYLLIFSMLLSPEFGPGAEGKGSGVVLRLEDFLLVLIGFSWLARMALFKELGFFTKTALNAPIFVYLSICILATTIGMLRGNVAPINGFFFVLKYFEYYVVYFLVVNNVRSREQIKHLVIAMLLTCMIVNIFGLSQIPGGGRVTAPFEGKIGEPNTLGGYLVLMISLSLALTLTLNKAKSKVGMLFVVTVSIVTLLFTLSRGSYIAFFPAYLTMAFFARGKGVVLIAAIVIGAMIAPVVIPEKVVNRIAYTFTQKQQAQQKQVGGVRLDTSTSARLNQWIEGIERATTEHPFLGFGVTGYHFVDTQFVKVLVDTGYIGLFAFIYLLYSIFNETRKIFLASNDPLYKGISLGFLGAMIGMLFHSLGANTFIIIRIMETFWLWVGLIMIVPKLETESNKVRLSMGSDTLRGAPSFPRHAFVSARLGQARRSS